MSIAAVRKQQGHVLPIYGNPRQPFRAAYTRSGTSISFKPPRDQARDPGSLLDEANRAPHVERYRVKILIAPIADVLSRVDWPVVAKAPARCVSGKRESARKMPLPPLYRRLAYTAVRAGKRSHHLEQQPRPHAALNLFINGFQLARLGQRKAQPQACLYVFAIDLPAPRAERQTRQSARKRPRPYPARPTTAPHPKEPFRDPNLLQGVNQRCSRTYVPRLRVG